MESQDHPKNHSSGHESHGVHLCHKCGWPFPNAHPSAKHRRAHKKICGTIEGYKLADSGDVAHSTASDEEQLSDEDHKTSTAEVAKVAESSSLEKSIGGIGAMSNRSECEVFSDAATEFQGSGFGLGRQGSMDNASKADKIVAEKDLPATISFKDCEDRDTDTAEPARHSVDRSQNENPDLENMPTQLSGTLEHQDLGLSHNKDSDGRISSAGDAVLIKPETLTGVSEESKKFSAVGSVTECSIGQGTDVDENEEGKSNKNLPGGVALPGEHSAEIFESVSVSEERQEVTSDAVLTDSILQLKEEFIDSLASKTSISENGGQEAEGKGNLGIDLDRDLMGVVAPNNEYASATSEKREDITSEIRPGDNIVKAEESADKLALKTKSTTDTDASVDTLEMKIDATQGADSATSIVLNQVFDKEVNGNESVYVLSVPDDIPVMDNAEIKLEGFKDHEKVKLPQPEAVVSDDDKGDEVRDHVSQEGVDASQSNQLDENIKVDESHMNVAEDRDKLGGDNDAMVKEVIIEGKGSDALVASVDTNTTENDKDNIFCSVEEKLPVNVSNDLDPLNFSGSVINVSPDVNPDAEARKLNNIVGSDIMSIPEGESGSDNNRRIDDESSVKETETLFESTNNPFLSQNNPGSDLPEVNNSDDIGTRSAEKDVLNVVESGGLEEGYNSMKTNSTSESIGSHHQSPVVTEEVNNKYVRTLSESEAPLVNRVSNDQDDIKEREINMGNEVQVESAGESSMASALDQIGGNDFERTSEDKLKRESMHLPTDAEPTSQSSGAVDDSHTKESGVDASGISTISLQGEAGNGSVKHPLDTTAVDVSVELSSQTDSLEGHWGSVSVLSTQSDSPAVIDTESLPSTGSHALAEAEKTNIKNQKVASEEQFHKSEEFEPPSFMTLVEPTGGDQKAAGDEIQTVQNAQNPRVSPLQAGWFPSFSHVADVSPGRKKNEEIIEKVTNWNAKQHTPLKNLLGEANSESKPKSPNSKESPAVVIPREEKVAKDNGALGTKFSSILGPETPVAGPTNLETGKEWNSPARYPADIKREKRKVKGRPLWVQFVCCSSAVN